MINIFKLIGILGLICIIVGVLIKPKNRKVRDILYIIGGISLMIYSFHIRDIIFIILQIVFTLVAVYDFIKLQFLKNDKTRRNKTRKI